MEDDELLRLERSTTVLNAAGLQRVLTDYVAYYTCSRTYLGLDKDSPTPRSVMTPAAGASCDSGGQRAAPPLRPRCRVVPGLTLHSFDQAWRSGTTTTGLLCLLTKIRAVTSASNVGAVANAARDLPPITAASFRVFDSHSGLLEVSG
jgi:hypothetical protein